MSLIHIMYLMASIGVVFSTVTIVNGIRAWIRNIKEIRKDNRERRRAESKCIIPYCKEVATEDLFVMVKFKGIVVKKGLKDTWKKCVCKECAKEFDDALLTTQWLSWTHFKCQDDADTGWYQSKPREEWPN
jgi:hypothetical protein